MRRIKRIKKLEEDVSILKNNLIRIEDEQWKVKNPPDYEIGDEIEYDCKIGPTVLFQKPGRGIIVDIKMDDERVTFMRWIYIVYTGTGLVNVASDCSHIKKLNKKSP